MLLALLLDDKLPSAVAFISWLYGIPVAVAGLVLSSIRFVRLLVQLGVPNLRNDDDDLKSMGCC